MKKFLLAAVATLAFGATAATAAAPTSVTLSQSRRIAILGDTIQLNGQVSPVVTGQNVTLTAKPFGQAARQITVTPNADGTYSLDYTPKIQTQFTATYSGTASQPSVVFVRERVTLRKFAHHRFAVTVVAARSLVGKKVFLSRWNRRAHQWKNVRAITLQRTVRGSTTTVAAFRYVAPRGTKLRIFMTPQAGYLSTHSNFIVA
jgi:hypothetical protein